MPQVGPAAKAPSISRWPCVDQPRRTRSTSSAGRAAITAWAPSSLRAPSSAANLVGVLARHIRGADHSGGRALRNRLGEQAFGGGHGQQRGDGVRAGALAEDRHVVGVAAEHRDVVAHPAQRHHQVAQVQVVVEGDVSCWTATTGRGIPARPAGSSPRRRHSPCGPAPRRRRSALPSCP